MKKAIIITIIFIIFYIIYFLQANLFTWFNIAGIMPNIFIIFILFIGLFTSKYMGASLGIIMGIFLDTFIGKTYGLTSIMLGIIGFLGGVLDKTFSKDSRITIMLMVIASTIIYETGIYLIGAIQTQAQIELLTFIKILIIEIIFNSLITIIIYPLLQKGGYYIEETFKNPNILTRYF